MSCPICCGGKCCDDIWAGPPTSLFGTLSGCTGDASCLNGLVLQYDLQNSGNPVGNCRYRWSSAPGSCTACGASNYAIAGAFCCFCTNSSSCTTSITDFLTPSIVVSSASDCSGGRVISFGNSKILLSCDPFHMRSAFSGGASCGGSCPTYDPNFSSDQNSYDNLIIDLTE